MEEYVDEEGELTPPSWIDFSRVEMEGGQQQAGRHTTAEFTQPKNKRHKLRK
jgi:hypothetical protein